MSCVVVYIEAEPISRRPTLYSVSTSGAACPGQSPVKFNQFCVPAAAD